VSTDFAAIAFRQQSNAAARLFELGKLNNLTVHVWERVLKNRTYEIREVQSSGHTVAIMTDDQYGNVPWLDREDRIIALCKRMCKSAGWDYTVPGTDTVTLDDVIEWADAAPECVTPKIQRLIKAAG